MFHSARLETRNARLYENTQVRQGGCECFQRFKLVGELCIVNLFSATLPETCRFHLEPQPTASPSLRRFPQPLIYQCRSRLLALALRPFVHPLLLALVYFSGLGVVEVAALADEAMIGGAWADGMESLGAERVHLPAGVQEVASEFSLSEGRVFDTLVSRSRAERVALQGVRMRCLPLWAEILATVAPDSCQESWGAEPEGVLVKVIVGVG